MTTLLEEFKAENRKRLEEQAAQPGYAGAYARLCLISDPNAVGEWVAAEVKAGTTSAEEIISAAAFHRALTATMVCSSFSNMLDALHALNCETNVTLGAVITGKLKGRGVAINRDGTQEEVTTEGLFRSKSGSL